MLLLPRQFSDKVMAMNDIQKVWLRLWLFVLVVASCGFPQLPTLDAEGGSPPLSLELLAGDIGGPGNADDTGTAARFYTPTSVTVDDAGNVYVADLDNQTIRKINAAGVVTTLAGTAGMVGSADGTGPDARFNSPNGVAVDSAGNVYVADRDNYTIRKVSAAGVVTTLAGNAGMSGSADGTGPDARFNSPTGVTVDTAGNVYVADLGNQTIRKITTAGVVTTLAGTAGMMGSADATGPDARFSNPYGVTVDTAFNVYVADRGNETIRQVTTTGVVTTLAGSAGMSGSADATGTDARFKSPTGVTVDSMGNVYVADWGNYTIRK